MPYSDPEKRKEASRKSMAKKRNVNPSGMLTPVNPNVNPVEPIRRPLYEKGNGKLPTPSGSTMVSGLSGIKALSAIRKLPVYNPNVTGFHPAPKGGK